VYFLSSYLLGVSLSRSYRLTSPIRTDLKATDLCTGSSIVSVTEMTVFAPISGSFSHYGGSAVVQGRCMMYLVDNVDCSRSLGRSRVGLCREPIEFLQYLCLDGI
jgi:hypothetical protein